MPPTAVPELVTFHTQSLRPELKRLCNDSSTGVLPALGRDELTEP